MEVLKITIAKVRINDLFTSLFRRYSQNWNNIFVKEITERGLKVIVATIYYLQLCFRSQETLFNSNALMPLRISVSINWLSKPAEKLRFVLDLIKPFQRGLPITNEAKFTYEYGFCLFLSSIWVEIRDIFKYVFMESYNKWDTIK